MTPLEWAADAWGRPVTAALPLVGGWTSTMLRLDAAQGERAVLRLMTQEPWRRHGAELVEREAAVQHQLAGTAIPAPASLAVDPTGAVAGDPAHLMSWLTGRLELGRDDDELLDRVAAMLRRIHAHDPGAARPRIFESWAVPGKRVVPSWAARPELWPAAFAVLDQPGPAYDPVFLHRDFHPGNLLWADGEISGVVDWVETSWGPAGLDVAHCATGLALLHGAATAARFEAAYDSSGRRDAAAQRHWAVMDVVGYLPDPTKVTTPWRQAGREDLTDELARTRLEQRLADVLS